MVVTRMVCYGDFVAGGPELVSIGVMMESILRIRSSLSLVIRLTSVSLIDLAPGLVGVETCFVFLLLEN